MFRITKGGYSRQVIKAAIFESIMAFLLGPLKPICIKLSNRRLLLNEVEILRVINFVVRIFSAQRGRGDVINLTL